MRPASALLRWRGSARSDEADLPGGTGTPVDAAVYDDAGPKPLTPVDRQDRVGVLTGVAVSTGGDREGARPCGLRPPPPGQGVPCPGGWGAHMGCENS